MTLRAGLTGFVLLVAGINFAPRPGWIPIVTFGLGFLLVGLWPSLVVFGARMSARPKKPATVAPARGRSPFTAQNTTQDVFSLADLRSPAVREIDSKVTRWRSFHATFHKSHSHPRCPWCQAAR
jgi:hypothetical protein